MNNLMISDNPPSNIGYINIPIFIPEEGCPNQCVFCNQRAITNHDVALPPDMVRQFVNSWLEKSNTQNKVISVAFFGGSFTGIPVKAQEAYLKEALKLKEENIIDQIRLSTRPDYINQDVITRLTRHSVDVVELGIQSLNDHVLSSSKRGHTSQTAIEACHAIKAAGMHLIMQTMIGLPASDSQTDLRTAAEVVKIKPNGVRIYPCLVYKDSELEDLYLKQLFTPLTLDEAVTLSAQLTLLYEASAIPILRIGLHASSGNQALIAGPFHPSFKALVETEIWNGLLKNHLKEFYGTNSVNYEAKLIGNNITIKANPSVINHAVGFEGRNKKELAQLFHEVRFQKENSLNGREFETTVIDNSAS